MLVSLLLTNPLSNKTKEERGRGTQRAMDQGNGLHLKLNYIFCQYNTIQEKACNTEVFEELKKSQ